METNQGAAMRPNGFILGQERSNLAIPQSRVQANMSLSGIKSQKAVRPARPIQDFDFKPKPKATAQVAKRPEAVQQVPPELAAVLDHEPIVEPELDILPAELEGIEIDEPHAAAFPAPAQSLVREERLRPVAKMTVWRRMLHGMAVLLFVVGVYVAVDGWFANHGTQTQASALSAPTQKTDKAQLARDTILSETLPMGLGNYRVAPDLPRILHIPSLSVVSRVRHLGVDENNSLAMPSNIYDTGWYHVSAKPTDKTGAIVIDGHVSGPTKLGSFARLNKLKAGDEVVLERGNRQMTSFVVVSTEIVGPSHLDKTKLLKSVDPNKLGLNLVTAVDKTASDRTQLIVYAVQK